MKTKFKEKDGKILVLGRWLFAWPEERIGLKAGKCFQCGKDNQPPSWDSDGLTAYKFFSCPDHLKNFASAPIVLWNRGEK